MHQLNSSNAVSGQRSVNQLSGVALKIPGRQKKRQCEIVSVRYLSDLLHIRRDESWFRSCREARFKQGVLGRGQERC